MVDENSQTSNRNDQELHSETVVVAVIGGPEFGVDQVDRGIRTTDVDHLENNTNTLISQRTGRNRRHCVKGYWCVLPSYLHACVIEGDEGAEQIQVACGEHNRKQDLALSRDTLHKHIKHVHH